MNIISRIASIVLFAVRLNFSPAANANRWADRKEIMLPPKLDELTLEESINIFVRDDKSSVDEYNNLSWNDPSIERHLSFISWRVSHATNFLVFLASRVSAQHSVHRTGGTRRKVRYHSSHGGGKHTRR